MMKARKAEIKDRPLFRFVSRDKHYCSRWQRLPPPEECPPRPTAVIAQRLGVMYGIEIRGHIEATPWRSC